MSEANERSQSVRLSVRALCEGGEGAVAWGGEGGGGFMVGEAGWGEPRPARPNRWSKAGKKGQSGQKGPKSWGTLIGRMAKGVFACCGVDFSQRECEKRSSLFFALGAAAALFVRPHRRSGTAKVVKSCQKLVKIGKFSGQNSANPSMRAPGPRRAFDRRRFFCPAFGFVGAVCFDQRLGTTGASPAATAARRGLAGVV